MSFRFKHFNVSHEQSSMKVGTDAVLLAAVADVKDANHILDAGTGCGVIALACAQRSSAAIHAVDIHEPSVKEANENFRNSPWAARLKAFELSLQQLAAQEAKSYDLIISNPPFFQQSLASPELSRHNARHNDQLPFRDFASAVSRLIRKGGSVWVILPVRESGILTKEMLKVGFSEKYILNVIPVKGRKPNRRIAEYKKNQDVVFTKKEEIIIRNADNRYTEIYRELTKDFYLNF
ncbi:MAG TPA: methyltransferase [Bacteroidales bacterium]|nr:methyltransferase [Bacteroidales bacterium]